MEWERDAIVGMYAEPCNSGWLGGRKGIEGERNESIQNY